jgi:Kef-type K+ transport system membrane component KefB
MLLLVAVAAVAAEAINLEDIVGAFLAGLAVNTATRDSEAKHELEFIGSHLFIPVFFRTIGFLIDLRTMWSLSLPRSPPPWPTPLSPTKRRTRRASD